jgi:hypothetical protein
MPMNFDISESISQEFLRALLIVYPPLLISHSQVVFQIPQLYIRDNISVTLSSGIIFKYSPSSFELSEVKSTAGLLPYFQVLIAQ